MNRSRRQNTPAEPTFQRRSAGLLLHLTSLPGRHGSGDLSKRWVHLDVIRLALNSVANTVIVPVQDLLGLGSEARMNRPGTLTGNWQWRVPPDCLTSACACKLRRMTQLAGRLPGNTNDI